MLVVRHIASFALLLALFSSRLMGVGALDRTFDIGTGADGVVTSIHPLPDGKVLVGGLFTQFNRVARPGLVRLLGDGSVDTSFDAQIQISPQGGVATLRVDATGRIYVGGAFSRAGNRAAPGLFRLQADGSIDTAFNASLPENSVVAAVAVAADGDTLWVGGLMVKGTTRTPLHRLTLNGAVVTGYTPPSAEAYDDLPIVLALHPLPDGRVIAAGEFYSIGGVGRGNVARVRPDGTIDVSYTASVPLVWTQINDLVPASDKGDLYLVGDFINLNDFEPGVIGRVSPSGAVDRTFTFKVGKSSNNNRPIVNRLLPQADGRFVAVGNFQQVDGKDRHFLARIFSDGILDSSFTAATDNEVVTIAEDSEGRWLIGGSFSRVNGQPAPTVARLQRQGDGPVFRLQPSPLQAVEGGAVVLRSVVVGAEASYEWYRDGRLVASSSEPTFGIVSASAADVGTYTVKARNRYGETTSTPIVVGVSRGRAGSVDPIVVPGTRDHGPVEVLMAWTSRREWAILSPGLRRLTFLDSDLKPLRTATLPGTGPLEVHCFAAGPDGSLWMGGRLEFPGRPSTSVVRVLADGTLDREFFTADGNVAYEAYDTRDGGVLVVVGRSTLVRYTASGSPHPTFVPPAHHILCAAVQPDGKIVYGWQEKPGPAEDPPLNVARMSAEGVPDPTFVAPSIVLPLTGGGTYALQTVRRIWIAANGNLLTNLEPSSMLVWLSAKGDHLSLITDPGSYGGWNVHALTDEGGIIADRPVYPRNPVYVRPDGTMGPPLFNDFSSDNRTPPSAPSPDVLLVRTWTGPNHDPTFSFQRVNLRSRGSSTLINLSGRGHTGVGSETFIAGFVTRTTSNQPLLLRGVGGGLADFGVSGIATNPMVELYAGETLVAGNDDWDETAARASAIRAAERDRGAFPLRSGAGDSAISQAVPPGMHTLQLQPGRGSAGVGLAEIYAPSGAKLVNLSLRGSVRSGERSLIGGFVIEGTGPRWVLLRAVGPGLAAFGISDFVPDPQLEVMSGSIRVASNNDWSQGDQYALIESAQRKAGAFALLPGSKDAAVVVELMPGQYSCVVSPGTVATGVGLLEIYHLD